MACPIFLICGPPGAGKSTAARESGLTVFDRDDEQWRTEQQFRAAITDLGQRRRPAVVIRSGASSSSRAKARRLIAASHVFLLLADRDELHHRVRERGRADASTSHVAIEDWFARFDRVDGVPDFPGWDAVGLAPTSPGVTSQTW